MKNQLIRICLYCFIALVPISCGTRKVSGEKTKTSDKEAVKINDRTIDQSSGTKSGTDTKIAQADKTKEGTKVTKETTYDPATGNKVSEKETTETKKSVDKSSKSRTRHFEETHIRYIDKHRNIDTYRTKTTYVKKKDTETDRNGLYWMIGASMLIGFFIYKMATITKSNPL